MFLGKIVVATLLFCTLPAIAQTVSCADYKITKIRIPKDCESSHGPGGALNRRCYIKVVAGHEGEKELPFRVRWRNRNLEIATFRHSNLDCLGYDLEKPPRASKLTLPENCSVVIHRPNVIIDEHGKEVKVQAVTDCECSKDKCFEFSGGCVGTKPEDNCVTHKQDDWFEEERKWRPRVKPDETEKPGLHKDDDKPAVVIEEAPEIP